MVFEKGHRINLGKKRLDTTSRNIIDNPMRNTKSQEKSKLTHIKLYKNKKNHPRYMKKQREDTKKKISLSKIEYFKSEDGNKLKKRLSVLKKGKHYSPNTEFKQGEHHNLSGEFKKGNIPWITGKKGIIIGYKFPKGKKHPCFNNWSSFEPYTKDFNKKFKVAIKERDGCCMLCNIGFDDLKLLKRRVSIHHIDYNKLNSFLQNCVSLCNSCHTKTNHNRKYWTIFFISLLKEKYNYKFSEDQKIIFDFDFKNKEKGGMTKC